MRDSGKLSQLIEEVDFQRAQRRHLRARGVHLIVTHSCHVPGTLCAPGEMIETVALAVRPQPISFGLSHMSLLLMNCLCHHRLPVTGQQIEHVMNTDPFYVHYASNRIGRHQCIARPDRRTVRVYVRKIWTQMGRAFRDAGLNLDPREVLIIETTDSKTVTYRLKATRDFVHLP